jgi:hypothetical protein
VAPFFTPEWGNIPAKLWRIPPSRQKPGWLSAAGVKHGNLTAETALGSRSQLKQSNNAVDFM